jgi:hypothetical protein
MLAKRKTHPLPPDGAVVTRAVLGPKDITGSTMHPTPLMTSPWMEVLLTKRRTPPARF